MNGRRLWLLAGALLLALLAIPALVPGEYGGTDGGAAEVLTDAGHEPWSAPIYEPPSGEVESALFAVQAAVGGALLGYYVGRMRGPARE